MILLIGPSASGKTEVSHSLRRLHGIVKAVTHTTRPPRVGEVDGVDYHFVGEALFLTLKDQGAFVETTEYNGHLYGCSKREIDDSKCVIVDPNGLRAFQALKNPSIVTFFLDASEATRRLRMMARGDSPATIAQRLSLDREDFDPANVGPTDFKIDTNSRTLDDIAEDIYGKYLATLKARGVTR